MRELSFLIFRWEDPRRFLQDHQRRPCNSNGLRRSGEPRQKVVLSFHVKRCFTEHSSEYGRSPRGRHVKPVS